VPHECLLTFFDVTVDGQDSSAFSISQQRQRGVADRAAANKITSASSGRLATASPTNALARRP